VDYVSDIVIEGFSGAITASTRYLLAQLDASALAKSEAGPLIEVDLELATPHMVWKPELGGTEKGSVQALVQGWLVAFLEVRARSLCAKRVRV
jgi:hypothetical protein